MKPAVWIDPPTNPIFSVLVNLSESIAEVAIEAWLYDVSQPFLTSRGWQSLSRCTDRCAGLRKFAHQFADEIISKLSGGLPGVAATQIAFVSSRGAPRNLGDGLRRLQQRPSIPEIDFAHSAVVA